MSESSPIVAADAVDATTTAAADAADASSSSPSSSSSSSSAGVVIDASAPVLVTGASGYVAGRIIELLLARGHTVHATVRDVSKKERLQHLEDLAAKGSGQIRFFAADLLQEGSFATAMQGCQVVFHTASPFIAKVKDAQKELIEPAQLGTRNVLEEANRVESVRRVVVTSSCAAIYGDNADVATTPQQILTEEIWNTSSSLTHQAYSFSKTLAEKEAWDIANKQSRWDLITINPSLVLGPAVSNEPTSESFNIVKQMGDGTLKTGGIHYGVGIVDVRDVAQAHYNAAFTPQAKGRYIVSGHNSDLFDVVTILQKKYGTEYPIPTKTLPKFLVWLVGPCFNPLLTRKIVKLNVNVPFKADNSKSIRELNMTYRPLEESAVEMFQQMIDLGMFKKKGDKKTDKKAE